MTALPNANLPVTALNAVKTAAVVLLMALLITGCGRKGPLEVPSARPVVDNQEESTTEPDEGRPFVLDRLLK